MATIVLVVANPANLTAGDTVIESRLIAAGHTVVLRDDGDPEYTGAYDGVFVSDSSSGGTFGAKYDTVAKPGITAENASWRLGTFLGAITGTDWTIENTAGNGELTGTHTIYTTPVSQQGIDTDILPAGATVVARLAGDSDHGVYVRYAEGGALTSGTAPAKRVFLRIGDNAMPNLTDAGITMLDAAIQWAFAADPGTPGLVSAGPDETITLGQTVSRTATEGSLGWVTSRSWTVVSGPAQVGATLSSSTALSWTPTVAGVYVIRYSASVFLGGTQSDEATITVDPPGPDIAPGRFLLAY